MAIAALVLGTAWYVGCDGAVEPDPNPPVAVDVIADRTVTNGDSVALDLSDHFIDPDGDTLSYTARASDVAVATASVSGAALTVRGLSPGRATVTVTAADPGGLSAEQGFQVTVPNRPPEAVGSIPGLEMFTGDSARVEVSDHFTDPDGGPLSYTVATLDPNTPMDTSVVAATVSGAMVTVTARSPGEATVTVKASDAGGLSAEQPFPVTGAEPAAACGRRDRGRGGLQVRRGQRAALGPFHGPGRGGAEVRGRDVERGGGRRIGVGRYAGGAGCGPGAGDGHGDRERPGGAHGRTHCRGDGAEPGAAGGRHDARSGGCSSTTARPSRSRSTSPIRTGSLWATRP